MRRDGRDPAGKLHAGRRPQQALAILRDETVARGHALPMADWRAAFERRLGKSGRRFSETVAALWRRGLVVTVGNGSPELQYCTAAAPQPAAPSSQQIPLDAAVLRVVTHSCEATNVAVPVGAILEALEGRGISCSRLAVRAALQRLGRRCRPTAAGGPGAASLEWVRARAPMSPRTRVYWRPTGTTYPPPAHEADNRRAHIRTLVSVVTQELGWMPSSLEIRAWALAHREHPSTVALGIRSRRAGTLMADLHPMLGERYEGDADAALAGFRGPMTVDGGAPVRFGAPDADLATRATARFIDVSYWLRPLGEIAGGDRLCAEASDVRAPALAELADIRASRMLAGFRESMAMVCGEAGIPWAEIARRLARGAGLLDDWWRATRRSAHARDPRWRRDARAAADTVDALQPQIVASPALDDLALAGVGGYRTLSDAADWVAQVLRPQGRTTAVAESLLLDVRRYPNPQRRPDQRMGDAVPFSVLDVIDQEVVHRS